MADTSRDANSTKTEQEKKPPETEQLTAEELKKIAAGSGVISPSPSPKIVTTNKS
jgi:hypothetical protein